MIKAGTHEFNSLERIASLIRPFLEADHDKLNTADDMRSIVTNKGF